MLLESSWIFLDFPYLPTQHASCTGFARATCRRVFKTSTGLVTDASDSPCKEEVRTARWRVKPYQRTKGDGILCPLAAPHTHRAPHKSSTLPRIEAEYLLQFLQLSRRRPAQSVQDCRGHLHTWHSWPTLTDCSTLLFPKRCVQAKDLLISGSSRKR